MCLERPTDDLTFLQEVTAALQQNNLTRWLLEENFCEPVTPRQLSSLNVDFVFLGGRQAGSVCVLVSLHVYLSIWVPVHLGYVCVSQSTHVSASVPKPCVCVCVRVNGLSFISL